MKPNQSQKINFAYQILAPPLDVSEIDARPLFLTELFRSTYLKLYGLLNIYPYVVTPPHTILPSIFTGDNPITNADIPLHYTVTGMFEDPALRHKFQRVKDECYMPMVRTMEEFACSFLEGVLLKSDREVKMQCGTKIGEKIVKAIEHFRRFEMVKDEKGQL
jgi:hypothetical protein